MISRANKVVCIWIKIVFVCLMFIILNPLPINAANTVNIYPQLNTSEFPSYTGLEVEVENQKLNLYKSSWGTENNEGSERSIGQFEYSGTPTVVITAPQDIKSAVIYPTPYGIKYTIKGKTCTFKMPENVEEKGKFEVQVTDVDGTVRSVDLLGDPIEKDRLTKGDESKNIYYFGSGVNKPGKNGVWNIENKDNVTIYIDRGAILKARINFRNCNNVTVRGRGVFRDGRSEKTAVSATFGFYNVNGLTFKDIALGRANNHQIFLVNVKNATINNIKEDAPTGNTDGITINSGCRDITVKNSFLMVNDDTIVINCDSVNEADTDNLNFENIIIGNRTNGHKLSFRGYTYGVANNIKFKNIYGIHTPKNYGFIKTAYKESAGIWLKYLKNMSFENVYVENSRNNQLMEFTSADSGEKSNIIQYGYISFKNVHFPGKPKIVSPQKVHIVLDHCYYGENEIASISDLSSSKVPDIEFVTGENAPQQFTIPDNLEIEKEENDELDEAGKIIPVTTSITIAEYGDTTDDIRIKHVAEDYGSLSWNRKAYVKINLKDIEIMQENQIKLWLHSDYWLDVKGNNNPVQIYEVLDNSWTNETISWPGPTLGELQSEQVVNKYGWIAFDIENAVNNALKEGKEELSLCIWHKNSNGSREYNEFSGINDNNAPYVEITNSKVPINEIVLSAEKSIVPINESLQINAAIMPVNATNKKLVWSSADPSIASVNESGVVTGIKEGETTITAKAEESEISSSLKIRVCHYESMEWDFHEWGDYTASGTLLSDEYKLGESYDYNGLEIVFGDSTDRINKGTWGILFMKKYSTVNSSYATYLPEYDGKLSVTGKAFQICEGSPNGEVVASVTETKRQQEIEVSLQKGKKYYFVSTAAQACRNINLKYQYLDE